MFWFIAYSSKGTKSYEATVVFDVVTNSAPARHISRFVQWRSWKYDTKVVVIHTWMEMTKTSYSEYVFLGNKAGIRQSMSRGNHMISSASWDKSARVNFEHAEIYAYVLLGLKLLVWFEIRPKLPFEIAKFSHSNTVFFICKIFYLSSIQLVCKKLIKLSFIFLQFDRFLKTSVEVWLVVVT